MGSFKNVDALIRRFAEETIPGCSVTVMKNGKVLYEGQAGYADIEAQKPVTEESMFRQASTTKLFTYTIMGMLYEEGKYLLSDPISEYLPEWKNTKKWVVNANGSIDYVPVSHPITIREAVSMACGLPYMMAPMKDPKNPTQAVMSAQIAKLFEKSNGMAPNLRDEVRVMAEAPVMFDPGTHWLYGFGSEITGALVETFEGKPLRKVFEDRLISPLGLKHTDTYIEDWNKDFIVKNYAKRDGQLIELPPESDNGNLRSYMPEGGRPNLLVSSHDFAVVMQMLANGGTYKGERYLSSGTVAMLHADQLNDAQKADFTNDYLAGYTYGLGFRSLVNQAYGHNGHPGAFGWTGGAGTWVEADPVSGISIAYMHNMMPNEELYHHHRIRAAVYGALDE